MFKKGVKNDHTKIYTEDLDSPRRELSNGGLVFVVALMVFSRINVLSISTGRPIQL